jgi:GNAT superfamily N-acetyltransferase
MIRKAGIEDLDVLTDLFDKYMVFYKKPSDFDRHRDYLKSRIEAGEATVFLANNNRNQTVGFTLAYTTFSSVRLSKIVILNDLFVLENVRNQNIGKELIEVVGIYAKEIGADLLRLRTAKSNVVAQGLYKKIGFITDDVYLTCDLIL